MFWGQLCTLLLSIFLIWWLWHTYKNNPDMFSKKSVSQSFTTMGVLALLLIALIALMVMLLRHGM